MFWAAAGTPRGAALFEVGQMVPAPRDHVPLIDRRRIGLQGDEGAGAFSPLWVRAGHHRRFQDGRVPVQRLLHLQRGDVLTTGDDDVLGAVLDLDIPVGMPYREVAGPEPAVA